MGMDVGYLSKPEQELNLGSSVVEGSRISLCVYDVSYWKARNCDLVCIQML